MMDGMTDAEHSTGRAAHPGLGWSRFGFGLGVVASTAANIAHSFTPSAELVQSTNELAAATGQTVDWPNWTPPLGTIIAAAFWPIALVVSVEVISRVQWPGGWRWKLMRFGGVAIVAAVAAFISYKHLHGLIRSYGEDAWSAAIGPLAIDGLMLVCSAALLAIGLNKRTMAPAERDVATPDPAPAPERTSTPSAPVETPDPRAARPAKAKRTRRPAVRLVQSDKDEPDLAKLRGWQMENGTPSLGQIEKLVDCGRSKAVRLRDRLAAEEADRPAV